MRQPLIASVVLHVALIALVVLGLPPSDRKLDIPASIPIEIVDIGEVTEAARVVKGDTKPEPPKPPMPEAKPTPPAPAPPEPVSEPPPPPPPPKAPEPPKVAQLPPPPPREPEPPKREPPPPPPTPEPAPLPKPVPPKPPEPPKPEPPKPEPPKPEPPKPEPPKPEPPKPEPPKPQPPKPEPPKPEPPKPQPPKPPEKAPDPLANLLKDVAKLKPTDQKSDSKAQPSTPQQTASAQAAPTGPKNVAGPDRAFKPSGKAIDAIRGQVSKNWNFDPGRKDSSSMVVQLRIDVALDGTVVKADFEPETRARMGSDSHFRSAAEAALRAVLRTQKLDLLTSEFTPDTYDKWRTIVFTFDPRDMF